MKSISSIRRKALRIALAAAVIPAPALAQHKDAGTEAYDFVNMAYDARSVALAGAGAALPNDVYGIFLNPASLGYLGARQAFVGYRQKPGGIFGAPAAYAFPEKDIGVFGVSLYGLTSGTVDKTDVGPSGEAVFTNLPTRADGYAGGVTWAKKFNPEWGAGVTVKGIYSYLKDVENYWSSHACALDAGIQCRFLNSRLVYGLAVHNLGFMLSGYEKEDSYRLPASVALGVSYVPQTVSNLRLIFDMSKRVSDYLNFTPAAEYELIRNQLIARAGYGFSWRDAQAFGDVLKGGSMNGYVKTNLTALCLGLGFLADVARHRISIDAAVEFPDAPVMPSFVLSVLAFL